MERCTVTVKEVAEYLGIHTDTVYDLVNEGSFPHLRFGRKILFSKDAIDLWVLDQVNRSTRGGAKDELY
ncbi:helix-turn-helix domain-containing protein [Aquibacillus salsiterrae]|uniref:Helix-turn-helix domain-containing protein n=1 Tax=Aquibacillus salsiterrae TaxID=2950439 RepID=A0A9X3WIM3_9BACI|nr:helix-turn-helix domain-containing protein [Aquibacillus salsiterrae]MDC3418069.1 helix-turn-helix domain-containing protein [Aquibacillus salsiterrae]